MAQIVSFKMVKVCIPQKQIRKLFYVQRFLTDKEQAKIGQKLTQIKRGIAKLLHAESVVEKVLLKADRKT